MDSINFRAEDNLRNVEHLSLNFDTLKKVTTEQFIKLFPNLKSLGNYGVAYNVYPHLITHNIRVSSLSVRVPVRLLHNHYHRYLSFIEENLESLELKKPQNGDSIEKEFFFQKFYKFKKLKSIKIEMIPEKVFLNIFYKGVDYFPQTFQYYARANKSLQYYTDYLPFLKTRQL